ncbi:MAG: biopolymer transporter ExbD [Holosporales bacterium]|jgi:biopolymer transport protein TolR|nr:biopolymer transporter ExbD [Holosporales bacterium]
MNSRKTPRQKPNININIAPLVEVMLVLIIIFMITAPILNVGIQVNLPKTQASSLDESRVQPIVISVDENSKIFIEEAEVTIEDLIQKLPMILENGKSDTVYVRGDKSLRYGTVMEIMGIISTAGAYKVSLISEMDTSAKKMNLPPTKITSPNGSSSTLTGPTVIGPPLKNPTSGKGPTNQKIRERNASHRGP